MENVEENEENGKREGGKINNWRREMSWNRMNADYTYEMKLWNFEKRAKKNKVIEKAETNEDEMLLSRYKPQTMTDGVNILKIQFHKKKCHP